MGRKLFPDHLELGYGDQINLTEAWAKNCQIF